MMEQHHILFSPLVSIIVIESVATAVAVILGIAFYRRVRGVAWRALLFTLLLLALANPSLMSEKREALKDTALVVIDDSASMKFGDRTAQQTQAAESITNKLAVFSDLNVETVHVSGDDETDLFRAIEQKRSTIPADRLAGIIAITDGQIHDLPAGNFNAPFHALIAGQKNEIDRRLAVKSSPAYGIVGQPSTIIVRIEDAPEKQSNKATLIVTRDDGTSDTLTVPVGEDVEIKTNLAHAGANKVAFEVEALPHEVTTINNVTMVNINAIRDRMRVLLVSGEPHNGGRNWRNLLKSDPAIDLIHFTILRSPFKDNSIPNKEMALIAFPTKEIFDTKLKDFDLVIFDGFSNRTLIPDNYLSNIANYVENGGALLITNATGSQASELNASPLARILPTEPNGELLTGNFIPALSDVGKNHPVTATLDKNLASNLWSPWYRQVDAKVKSANSQILLTGLHQKPLLVLSHVGKGRVAQYLSNQFWLWARDYPNGGPEAELLRRTAHWLVAEPELDETALHATSVRKDDAWQLTITKQHMRNDDALVVVTGPDNQPLQVKLQSASESEILGATLPIKTPGLYHIKDQDHEILTMVGTQNTAEYGAVVATDAVAAPIAKTSGGSVLWLADNSNGPDIRRTDKNSAQSGWGWIGLQKNGQYRVTGSEGTPLCPAWLMLALALAAMMWMWRREGR